MKDNNWALGLNEYIRQGEPDKVDKSNDWQMVFMRLQSFWNYKNDLDRICEKLTLWRYEK